MDDSKNLQDWEILSDFDTKTVAAFEEIIHSDYFALDSNKLHAMDKNLMDSQSQIDKGGSFLAEGAKTQMGFDGIDVVDAEINKGGSFLAEDSGLEEGVEGNDAGDSFHADDSKMELGFEGNEPWRQKSYVVDSKDEDSVEEIPKGDSFVVGDAQMEVGFGGNEPRLQNSCAVDSEPELGVEGTQKGASFRVDDTKMVVGAEQIETIDKNSDEAGDLTFRMDSEDEKNSQALGSLSSSFEMSNSESIPVGDGEKKVFIWWKLPMDLLKLCASRVRPVWSISIAAAVIGILMVGRKLYKMKHKSRRTPLKFSFEDKVRDFSILLLIIFCKLPVIIVWV